MSGRRLTHSQIEDLKAQAVEENEEIWLVTMGDMSMLLLTFFVLLYAIIAPTSSKFSDVLRQIGGAMHGKPQTPKVEQEDPIELAKYKIKSVIADSNLVNEVEMTSDTRGIVIYSKGDFFFPSGSAEVLPDTRLFLKKVADIIRELPNTVLVEGHTDDVPTHTDKFPSNWELSTARRGGA